jgi:plastocyanin
MRTHSEGTTDGGTPGTFDGGSGRRLRRMAVLFAGFGVAALIAAGCGSSASSTASSGTTATGSASTITVQMTEYKFVLSQANLSPGTYTFHTVNAGKIVHSLTITGPGLSSPAATKNTLPGQSADLTVTLQAGSYDFYCPIGDHKALGMDLEVSVAGSAAGTPGSSSSEEPITTQAPATTTVPSSSGGGVSY